jgi:uroporphyrinogen decarboxylase
MVRYVRASIEAGADGLFFATQTSTPEFITQEENGRWGAAYAQRVLEAARGLSTVTLLHIHGRDIFFDQIAALPVNAVNWHDRLTAPSLAEAKRRVSHAVVGGLAEGTTLRTGPAAAIAAQVKDALAQTGGTGIIVGPGCVLPLDVPDAHLQAVVDAARGEAK